MSYYISSNLNFGYPYQDACKFIVQAMSPTYPVGIYSQTEGGYPLHAVVSNFMNEVLVEPYPCSFYIQKSGLYPRWHNIEVVNTGVCLDCKNLKEVIIPASVQRIRDYSFWNTALAEVTISKDCVFYEHSFPETCKVYYYE